MARNEVRQRRFLREDRPDLTPLADCVFLLLIFFMVTTVFITSKGLSVDLPKASKAAEAQLGKDINLVIEEDGSLELNGERVAMAELGGKLKEARQLLQTDNMMLQAYPKTLHRVVVEVIDVAKGHGIEGIAFVREIE